MMGILKTVILIVLFFTPAVGTAGTVLTFPLNTQEHSRWCWAAASQSVLSYYGTNVLQCRIVDYDLGYTDSGSSSCTATDSDGDWEDDFDVDLPYNTGVPSLADIQKILANWGISSMETGSYLDQKTCASEITAGRPFPIALYWAIGGGHAIVGYGYDGTFTNVTNVYIMDPARIEDGGGEKSVPYNTLVNNPGVSTWGDTLQYVQQPSTSCYTQFAWSITPTSAILSGMVSVGNQSSTVSFDYGTSTSYDNTVTADQSPVTGITVVSKTITNLAQNTLYHFRVKVVSGAQTIVGTDQTFTTPGYSLTINKMGTGSGTISQIGFITPIVSYEMIATPNPGSAFTGWSGDCSGTGDCYVYMTGNRTVSATFDLILETLSVSELGTGKGTITSTSPPSVVNCDSTCSYSIAQNTQVTLTASPSLGNIFTGWSGACSGKGACSATMASPQTVNATFVLNITPILNLLLSD